MQVEDNTNLYQSATSAIRAAYKKRIIALDSMKPDYDEAIEQTLIIIELMQAYNNIPRFKDVIVMNGKKLYPTTLKNGAIVYSEKTGDNLFIPMKYYYHIQLESDFLMHLRTIQATE